MQTLPVGDVMTESLVIVALAISAYLILGVRFGAVGRSGGRHHLPVLSEVPALADVLGTGIASAGRQREASILLGIPTAIPRLRSGCSKRPPGHRMSVCRLGGALLRGTGQGVSLV